MLGYDNVLFPIRLNSIPSLSAGQDGPIVVVDDDQEQREIIFRYYQKSKRPNEILLFPDADSFEKYMDAVRLQLEKRPALVLLDINMPGKSGFTALKNIRSVQEFLSSPPIVMFSVSDYQNDIQMARSEGATAYITKPSRASDYEKLFVQI